MVGTLVGLLIGSCQVPPAPRLVWNPSASAPVGLYEIRPGSPVVKGDLVLARLPEPWRSLAARRRYLPSNVPILKRVAASQGDLVCARGDQIRVNQAPPMKRQAHDRLGRALDGWGGCRRLVPDEYLLLMSSPDSFDGRYFGPTPGGEIIGTARPLWTW